MDKPSIGRMVHYVVHKGRHLPAVITDVKGGGEKINVYIIWDPQIPKEYELKDGAVDVPHSEKEHLIGSWHWPERV